MAKNAPTVTTAAPAELVKWQPRDVHGATFAQLAANAVPVSEFEAYTKTECEALVGKPFVITDVKIHNDLVNGEFAFVACVTEDNVSRYFTSSTVGIMDAVQRIIEQGAGGSFVIVPRGLACKAVPALPGWTNPKTGGVETRPAFKSFSFSS